MLCQQRVGVFYCVTVLPVRADNVRIADTASSPGSRQIRYLVFKVLVVHERKASPNPIAGAVRSLGCRCDLARRLCAASERIERDSVVVSELNYGFHVGDPGPVFVL